MSEGLHLICRGGVTRPFEMDPFVRRLAYYLSISLEKLTALIERWNAAMRKVLAASREAGVSIALLGDTLKELECES